MIRGYSQPSGGVEARLRGGWGEPEPAASLPRQTPSARRAPGSAPRSPQAVTHSRSGTPSVPGWATGTGSPTWFGLWPQRRPVPGTRGKPRPPACRRPPVAKGDPLLRKRIQAGAGRRGGARAQPRGTENRGLPPAGREDRDVRRRGGLGRAGGRRWSAVNTTARRGLQGWCVEEEKQGNPSKERILIEGDFFFFLFTS